MLLQNTAGCSNAWHAVLPAGLPTHPICLTGKVRRAVFSGPARHEKHCHCCATVYFNVRMSKTFAQLNFPGRLIAVEGLDGSGKSTQIYLLKRWLELQGLRVFFSEWNSSEIVKSATSKGKKRELLTPTTFSLIHATDFADRYERQLVPLLRAGYIVLCDRYVFTAFARDTVRGCPPEWVRSLYGFAAHPDLTFFFKAQLEVSLQRILDGRPHLSGPHPRAISRHEHRFQFQRHRCQPAGRGATGHRA